MTARLRERDRSARSPARPPLWTCPRCRHRFVTRNLWHSCIRVPLANHFVGKDPKVRVLFNHLRRMIRRCGPVTIYAQKTRIVFQGRVRFAGAVPRKHCLEAGLWLKRRVTHPALTRVEDFGRLGYGLHFRFTEPEQLNPAFVLLVHEAYAIGQQQDKSSRP
ncbi:MAG TPA: DUF5655 domain-containing protein [Gemmatimonadales bacterium]